jgi:hypothetical protein
MRCSEGKISMPLIFAALALLLSCAVTTAAPFSSSIPADANQGLVRPVQACGFYAILGCFGTRGEAQRWSNQIEDGYVINTTSAEYPNFRSGYYCVVNGPTSVGRAQSIAAGWRGVVPSAYAKNAC